MDTLAYAKRLRAAGVSEQQAEAHAEALRNATTDNVVTKTDLAELETRLIKWMVALIVPVYALLVGVLLSLT